MRKRLRKKLQKGEFAVPVIPIAFRMREMATLDRNDLLDRFYAEAIEENGLQFGSGGVGLVWSGYAEPAAFSESISAGQRSVVDAWIASEPRIVDRFVGDVIIDVETVLKREPEFPRSRLGAG